MTQVILINAYHKAARGINEATITPPLGLAYLAAVLERGGHKVQLIDAQVMGSSPEEIPGYFNFTPDLVGISANIVTYRGAIACANAVKVCFPAIPVILGGPYPSSLPQEILERNASIDAVVIGEAEDTILEVVHAPGNKNAFENIKGVCYRYDGMIIHNATRPLKKNLDDIPPPAYHFLTNLKSYKSRSRGFPSGYIITSRGCPFACSFCNKNTLGKEWRPHSAERVIDEIEYLVARYRIRHLDILDDNFTYDYERAHSILDKIIEKDIRLHINLQNGIRVDKTDEKLLRKMKRAGVFKIGFGIESADYNVQSRAGKIVDLEKVLRLTTLARSLGIVTHGFFMVGLPGDTPESLERTLEFAIRMNPHFANLSICIPFPGSEIYQEIKKEGEFLIDVENGIDLGFSGARAFYRLDGMNTDDIETYFKKMNRRFYLRLTKLLDMLFTIRSFGEARWLFDVTKDIFLILNNEVASSRP